MRHLGTGRAPRALGMLLSAALVATLACSTASRTTPVGGSGGTAEFDAAAAVHATHAAPLPDTTAQHATGRRIVETVCATCHTLQPPPKTAPPLAMIAMHYRRASASDTQAVARMVEWVRAPDATKSLLPPRAIREFGLMPPQPLPDSLLRAAAAYVMSLQHAMPMHDGMQGDMQRRRGQRGPP